MSFASLSVRKGQLVLVSGHLHNTQFPKALTVEVKEGVLIIQFEGGWQMFAPGHWSTVETIA